MRFSAILLTLFIISPAIADEYRSKINEGYDYYKSGEYDKAVQQFKDAGILKPEKGLPIYNRGTALYKSNDFEGAAGEFKSSGEKDDPKLRGDAYYNTGNSFFKAQKFDQAIKSYVDALKVNPKDKDAKHNLEMALLQQQMQQQQQQKQDQNKKDQKQDQQNQQNKQDQQKEDQQKQDQQQEQNQQEQKDQKQQSQQPKPSQQKMDEQQAQELLARFAEDEKDVQKKLKQINVRSHSINDW